MQPPVAAVVIAIGNGTGIVVGLELAFVIVLVRWRRGRRR